MGILNTACRPAAGLEVGVYRVYGCCLAFSRVPNAIFPSLQPTYPVTAVVSTLTAFKYSTHACRLWLFLSVRDGGGEGPPEDR